MLGTIIVDDEIDAVKFIESIITEYCKGIKVLGYAHSAADGVQLINALKPDLIFLDVEMPHGSGFELLSHFPDKNFDVIFVTAFNHYAIQAIKFSAVDYILKPININEFIEAVKKVALSRKKNRERNFNFDALLENLKTRIPSRLAIPASDGMEYLNTDDIIRIEADRSYSWFYLNDKRKLLVSRNLKEYQELLSDRNFFRTHNSHLINLNYVRKFIRQEGGYIQMKDDSTVPVSRGKKDLFLEKMAALSRISK